MTDAAQDWRDMLADYMIKAGTVGKKKSEIVTRFQGKIGTPQITAQLDVWHLEDKVQKFDIPSPSRGGRTSVIWRATTKLVEDGI